MEEIQPAVPPSKPAPELQGVKEELPANDAPAEVRALAEPASANLLADSLEQGKAMLNEHKGKLAMGVAATLGLMVFYKWREKNLAEEDPEEYARLQRIKAVVREQGAAGVKNDADADD